MAGPAKKRAQADKQPNGSSNGSSSESRDPTQRSVPKPIPRLDGNRDPSIKAVVDYANPNDLKNISDFLGLGGWYAARGVSTNTIFFSACACIMHTSVQTHLPFLHIAEHANNSDFSTHQSLYGERSGL